MQNGVVSAEAYAYSSLVNKVCPIVIICDAHLQKFVASHLWPSIAWTDSYGVSLVESDSFNTVTSLHLQYRKGSVIAAFLNDVPVNAAWWLESKLQRALASIVQRATCTTWTRTVEPLPPLRPRGITPVRHNIRL